MGFRNSDLRAIALATLVALAGVSAFVAPATAADPSPTPAPEVTPSPTLDPATATPDPATPTPTPDPATSAPGTTSPAPTPIAAPETLPQPTTTPTAATTTLISPAPSAKPDLGALVARIALAQRHRPYVRGAMGPRAFDCSGLVRYAYRRAGVTSRLGGGHSARAMLRWARLHHLASRSNPRVGDVVIYGNGSHAAIYIGHGLVISALNPRQGIRVTRLHALRVPVTAFIHTHLPRK